MIELKKITNSDKNLTSKIDNLVENFIKEGSKKEINISSETRKNCFSRLDVEKNIDAFDILQQIIIREMKYDSFKRFVRSKDAVDILKRYSTNSEICQPILTTEYNYKNEDFMEQRVKEEDFKFMDMLSKDSPNWELLTSFKSKDGKAFGNSFWALENYIPDVTIAPHVSIAKYEIILPYSFEHVCCSFYPLCKKNFIFIG